VSADFLTQMAACSRERVRTARAACPESVLMQRALAVEPAPALRLTPGGFDLIAEMKLRSPAAGRLKEAGEGDVAKRVRAYARAGACAVSVLTEPSRFEGSLEHLSEAAAALRPLGVPAMRKDFLVDPYQVIEARVSGAGGVLAILRMLSDAQAAALIRRARELSLFVLLETFDERDIERLHGLVRQLGGTGLLAGVNSRDLATLEVVPSRLEQLGPRLPECIARVAESGVGSAEDAARMAQVGYDLALVGSALMREENPEALVRALLEAGRIAKRGATAQEARAGAAPTGSPQAANARAGTDSPGLCEAPNAQRNGQRHEPR
jgi:indole-3-glycerol phosphate synthase